MRRPGRRWHDDDDNACTLQEVADVLGVTRERVRQIEAGALKKLRKKPETRALRDMLRDEQLAVTETVRVQATRDAWERLFAQLDRTHEIMTRPLPARFRRRKST